MILSSGTTIGPYKIDRKLGAGGIGQVYKATHQVLGRVVALKTLATETSGDVQATRFIQEARTISALNHPNIVTVYDVTDLDGKLYIAMEYVEGETLQKVLADRALTPEEAIRYGIQIANALAAAHASGILHRDIKPGNIMITRNDAVKVLDFGLAKRFEPETHSDAPTRTIDLELHLTNEGFAVGTVAYMSPEQAEGLRVDARSDIFSFGIVLYEMLTRVHPFHASSWPGTMARILQSEPPPLNEKAAVDLPLALEQVVRLCLRKNPEERPYSMHDVAQMLEIAEQAMQRPPALPLPNKLRWVAWVTAGLSLLLALVAGWTLALNRSARQAQHKATLRRLTWDPGLFLTPALSNDGYLIAFASDRHDTRNLDIYVRHVSGGQPIRLTTDAADDSEPSFSPDGSTIAFRSERQGGGVYLVPSLGGQERLIGPRGNDPRFSPDGKSVAYWVGEWSNTVPSARLYIVSATGGAPRQLQPSFADARNPVWTPDGKHILFQGVDVWKSEGEPDPDWWVTPVDGGTAVRTGAWAAFRRAGLSFIYPAGGWDGKKVVFSAQDDTSRFVYAVPMSMRTWHVDGPPEALTFGTGIDGAPYPSPSGAIAFSSFEYQINIWSRQLDSSGRVIDKGARKLTNDDAYHSSMSLNVPGTRMVYLLGRSPSRSVWVRDMNSKTEAAITVDAADKCSAAISPDGSRVAWSLCGPETEPVFIATLNPDLTVSLSERICDDCGRLTDWSPAGDSILFTGHSNPKSAGILNLSTRVRTFISSGSHNLASPHFSPEGQWIALAAAETRADRAQLFAIPVRNGNTAPESEWVPVTDGRFWDDKPVWSENGDALLFYSRRDGYGCIWRQAVNPKTKRPEGAPEEIQPFHTSRLVMNKLLSRMACVTEAHNQLFFNVLEWAGSVWLLDNPRAPR